MVTVTEYEINFGG